MMWQISFCRGAKRKKWQYGNTTYIYSTSHAKVNIDWGFRTKTITRKLK